MEALTIAYIGLSLALCALFLGVIRVRKADPTAASLEELADVRRTMEQRYDEFIDHRDKARTWINREKTREARASNSAEAETPVAPQSHQEEKQRLRALDRASRMQ